MDSLFIGLELCEFCVFNDGLIVYNDCFEMKYEWECVYYCDILLSIKVDAAVNLNTIGIRSCQIIRIGCNSFSVSSPTAITAGMLIKNEKEMKYKHSLLVPQAQTQSQHATPLLAEKSFNFDPTGAGPGKLDDLEYILCVSLSKDGFYYDINNVFKWCNGNFNGNYHCNIYCASAGMLVFDF